MIPDFKGLTDDQGVKGRDGHGYSTKVSTIETVEGRVGIVAQYAKQPLATPSSHITALFWVISLDPALC